MARLSRWRLRVVFAALCLLSAVVPCHATNVLASWNSTFGFAGTGGVMPTDSIQLTLLLAGIGSTCPSQCPMLFDPILPLNSVGSVFITDSTASDFAQVVSSLQADDVVLEYFPDGTGFGSSADRDFGLAIQTPLFPGDTITDFELTITSSRFQINNAFTGAGARIFGFDLTVNGTGPVPPAPIPEPTTWMIGGAACLATVGWSRRRLS
jgi:hypothetical protein